MEEKRLLNTIRAALYLGQKRQTLEKWRIKGTGPKFVKMGDSKRSAVAYDPADLDAWLEARKSRKTGGVDFNALSEREKANDEAMAKHLAAMPGVEYD